MGAIRATAAIVFREASDTLGIESEHDDDEGEGGTGWNRRPICAWRSWQMSKRTGSMYILNVHIHSAILFRYMVCVLDRFYLLIY